MADKIVVLNNGKIEQIGSRMTLYNHLANPFVAGFIGSAEMNLFGGEFAEREACRTYGIRPEDLALSNSLGATLMEGCIVEMRPSRAIDE
ncbi:ABC-type sugar transport system ATPase subunit [Rhizobium sp. BK609]|nr:ABC-type sugar transport system ATPase subunit [Rhizobium sp. BK098]MBB3617884.1 ABC-type sugar transport system ATPase subunit [Rhizobium sp. BK609]MBB3683663.1 ABC-type sugar transport system ATPase subunit [Rhizobium sp. BK612]